MFVIILAVIVLVGGAQYGQQEYRWRGGQWSTLEACETVRTGDEYQTVEARARREVAELVRQRLQTEEKITVIATSKCEVDEGD